MKNPICAILIAFFTLQLASCSNHEKPNRSENPSQPKLEQSDVIEIVAGSEYETFYPVPYNSPPNLTLKGGLVVKSKFANSDGSERFDRPGIGSNLNGGNTYTGYNLSINQLNITIVKQRSDGFIIRMDKNSINTPEADTATQLVDLEWTAIGVQAF